MLFSKCDITKFRIPPLSHNVTHRRPPTAPLTCDVIYGCPQTLKKMRQGNTLYLNPRTTLPMCYQDELINFASLCFPEVCEKGEDEGGKKIAPAVCSVEREKLQGHSPDQFYYSADSNDRVASSKEKHPYPSQHKHNNYADAHSVPFIKLFFYYFPYLM